MGRKPIALNSFVVLFQKLLLYAQVVVSDGQHGDAVLELFLHGNSLALRDVLPLRRVRQEVEQQRRLNNHDCLVRVYHRHLVPVELRQDRARVQVSVGHRRRLILLRLNVESLLEVDEGRAQVTEHAIVARQVVVSHGQTCFIVLGQGL